MIFCFIRCFFLPVSFLIFSATGKITPANNRIATPTVAPPIMCFISRSNIISFQLFILPLKLAMQNVLISAVPHRSEWRRRRTTGGGRRQRQERGRCGCCSDRQRRPRNYRLIFNRGAVREFCYTRYLVRFPALLLIPFLFC